jgi:signal transduction histidine kinase
MPIRDLAIANPPIRQASLNEEKGNRRAKRVNIQAEHARQSREKLEQLKDELIQNLCHELRMPLTFVLGYAHLLQDGMWGAINTEQSNALSIVITKTNELASLVEDIVSLGWINPKNLSIEIFSLVDLLEDAISAYDSDDISVCHRFEKSFRVGSDTVFADKGLIKQASLRQFNW